MKLKIGDRVRIRADSDFHEQSATPGRVVKKSVASADLDEIWWWVKFEDGYENSYQPKDLEPAGLKVGDKVKVVESGTNYNYSRDGSEGVIVGRPDESEFLVKFSKLTGEDSKEALGVRLGIQPRFLERIGHVVRQGDWDERCKAADKIRYKVKT